MNVSPLEKAEMHLDYWKRVKNGEIENDLDSPEDSLAQMIEYFENKVVWLKENRTTDNRLKSI